MEHGRNWCTGAFSWGFLYWGLRLTGGGQGVETEGGRGRTASLRFDPVRKLPAWLNSKDIGIKIPLLCSFVVYSLTRFQCCVWTRLHRSHERTLHPTVKKKTLSSSAMIVINKAASSFILIPTAWLDGEKQSSRSIRIIFISLTAKCAFVHSSF